MIYTAQDAISFCAADIDGGRETTDPVCLDRINEAEMVILQEVKTIDLRRVARFYVDSGKTFPLPEMVESVLAVSFNGVPARVRGMGYEFLDSGPGPELDHCGRSVLSDLRDLGDHWPTFYPIGYAPRKLIAFSDSSSDLGLKLRLRGWDAFNMEIAPATPGEELRISCWQDGVIGTIDHANLNVSAYEFQELTSIVKPVTVGYVSLYAFDPDTSNIWFLSRYAPHETQPGYRRYEILNKSCDSECYIHALVQLRHVKLRHATDPLTIQNLIALRFMCQSLHESRQRNTQLAVTLQAQAVRSIMKQSDKKATDDMIMDFDVDMAMGSVPEI